MAPAGLIFTADIHEEPPSVEEIRPREKGGTQASQARSACPTYGARRPLHCKDIGANRKGRPRSARPRSASARAWHSRFTRNGSRPAHGRRAASNRSPGNPAFKGRLEGEGSGACHRTSHPLATHALLHVTERFQGERPETHLAAPLLAGGFTVDRQRCSASIPEQPPMPLPASGQPRRGEFQPPAWAEPRRAATPLPTPPPRQYPEPRPAG